MQLELSDIEVVYGRRRNRNHAVRGVTLCVRRGETLAVVGESGSGKTTIAKVAAGLQKATAGTLTWSHADGVATNGAGTSRRVQMVFQHPVQSLDPAWKVRRSVLEPLRHRGVSHDRADQQVREAPAPPGPGEIRRGEVGVAVQPRDRVGDTPVALVDQGRREAAGGAVHAHRLVHRPLQERAASPAEQAELPVRIEAAMAHPPALEHVPPRQVVADLGALGADRRLDLVAERIRDPLVGVDRQEPVPAALPEGEVLLGAVAVPGVGGRHGERLDVPPQHEAGAREQSSVEEVASRDRLVQTEAIVRH